MDAFFEPLADDRFLATVHTTGPWTAGFQHGGPPSALLARAVERCEPDAELMVARVTVEILGPLPVAELAVRARVVRPGKRVQLVEAVLSAGGRDVARASAWRVRRTAQSVPTRVAAPAPLPVEPGRTGSPEGWIDGYLSAIEWRPVSGAIGELGPGVVWTRLRHPLVAGEEPSPLVRVVAVADSGNGASGELDPAEHYFINPELTVHLHREAVGEWVCLDAQTAISPGGVGLATSVLSDLDGALGVGAQSLLVAPR